MLPHTSQQLPLTGHSPCEGRPLLSTTGSLLGLLQELQRLVGKGEGQSHPLSLPAYTQLVSSNTGMARVARVLSKLSFELEALANSHRGAWKQGKQAVLDLQSPGLQSWAVEVGQVRGQSPGCFGNGESPSHRLWILC